MDYQDLGDEFEMTFKSEQQENEYFEAMMALGTNPELMDAYDVKYSQEVQKQTSISYSKVGNSIELSKAEERKDYKYRQELENGRTLVSMLPIVEVKEVGETVSAVPNGCLMSGISTLLKSIWS